MTGDPASDQRRIAASRHRTLGGLSLDEALTLARCAAVTLFDDAMYDSFLQAPDGPVLSDLVGRGAIERLTGNKPRFRLVGGLRDLVWSYWYRDTPGDGPPAELSEFGHRLDDHFRNLGRPVEWLRARVRLDVSNLSVYFRAAFREAQERGDITTCASLLGIAESVADESERATADLLDSVRHARRALGAMGLGKDLPVDPDYLGRPGPEQDLDAQIDRGALIRLQGKPGHGKSTLLRRLVHDRFVGDLRLDGPPTGAGRFAACAFLDFDRLDPVRAVQHPWLVALEIARQFNDQLPDRLFTGLLDEGRADEQRLLSDSPYPAEPREPGPSFDPDHPVPVIDPDDVVARLLHLLPDAVDAGQRALVVLDTFESVMLLPDDHDDDVRALVQLLRELTMTRADVRLVISGRGNAREDELLQAIGSTAEPVTVDVFTPGESRRYLSTRRITRPELVELLLEKSGRSPWHLAIGAAVVEGRTDITADELREIDIETAWVVDRVVSRIEPELRWLVLFGSIARRLDSPLVTAVFVPRIARMLAGHDGVPRLDLPIHADVFRTNIDLQPAAELWSALVRYRDSGPASWLHDAGPDTVTFDLLLRDPLRRLLEKDGVDRELHAELVRYFEDRVAQDGPGWCDDTRELLHHRARLTGAVSTAAWRAALARTRVVDRPDWTVALADDLLGPDYRREGQPVATPALRATAHLERAWARARIEAVSGLQVGHGLDSVWTSVEDDLHRARTLGAVDTWTMAAVASASAMAHGREEEAPSAVPADPDALSDRRDLLLVRARAAMAAGHTAQVDACLRGALDVVGSTDRASTLTTVIVDLLAEWAARGGHLAAATGWAARGPATRSRLWLRARVALASGRPGAVLALTDKQGFVPARTAALIALCRPADALAECRAALRDATLAPAERAAARMSRGIAHAALLAVDEAVIDLTAAAREFRALGDVDSVAACDAHLVRVYLRDIGNLRDAEQQLDELQLSVGRKGSAAWVRHRMLLAELSHEAGRADDARDHAAAALDAVGKHGELEPALLVEAAVGALSWAPQLRDRAVALLAPGGDAGAGPLVRISPGPARAAALGDAETLPDGCLPSGFASLLESDHDGLDSWDRAWLAGRSAELLRATGDRDAALAAAERMLADLPRATAFARWRLLQAVLRIDGKPPVRTPDVLEADPKDDVDELARNGSPLLAAAFLVEVVEMRIDRQRSHGRFRKLLQYVERELFTPPAAGAAGSGLPFRPTRWHLRSLELQLRLHLQTPWTVLGRRQQRWRAQDLTDAIAARSVELGRSKDGASVPGPGDGPSEIVLTAVSGRSLVLSVGTTEMRLDADQPLTPGRASRTDLAGAWEEAIRAGDPLRLQRPDISAPTERDLRIVEELGTAQVPWELGTVNGTPLARLRGVGLVYRRPDAPAISRRVAVRVLQEELAAAGHYSRQPDGDLGPWTRRAVRELKREARQLSVDDRVDASTWRLIRAGQGAGTPSVLHVRTADDLALATDSPVDVLHVRCGMGEEHGRPYLMFGSTGTTTVADLGAAVGRIATRGGRTPHVLLDVAGDARLTSETTRRMLLRNEFAHTMIALGQAHSVLATGLVVGDRSGFHDGLTAGLSTASTIADLARLLQRTADDADQVARLPWVATALFSCLPPGHLPALRSTVRTR